MKPTMMTYIHEEREVLANILLHYPAGLPAIAHKKEWLILATGSSINAAKSAKHYVEHIANTRITIEEPFNYQHYEKHNPAIDLVIGVSQSGESTSTINAIEYLKSYYPLTSYGVTSKPQSELSKIVDFTVDINIGEERVGYVTKGYVATILTLMLIGLRSAAVNGIISKEREDAELAMLKHAVEQIPHIIDDTEAFYHQWQNELNCAPRFTTIAYGPNMGTCKEMETKFSETVRVPSQGIELESFMHGPYFEVNAQHRIFFIEVDSIAQERLSLLRNYEKQHTDYIYTVKLGTGDNSRTLAINADINELVSPLLLVIPFQILAHHIAEAKGNNLPQRIFTDFGVAMKSKTKPGDYA